MSPVSSSATAAASRPHPTRSMLILGLAALSYALAQTTVIPALSELERVFDADASAVAWTLTGYLIAAAILTPVFGRLGDMFGKRRMLVISLALFAAGSFASALGDSLPAIVAGRVLQGAGGGIFPLCFGIIRDEFPPERVSVSVGLVSATAGIGGGIGLVLGGLILDHASYHWIFWLGGVMATATAISTRIFIPESPNRRPARIDVRGALILACGLTAPMIAIAQANDWGWLSARTLGLVGVGVAILAFWVWVERRTKDPLADIATLTRAPVLMTNLATLFIGFGIFTSFVLIPQLVEAPISTGYGFGADATRAGLLMLPAALGMLVAGPVSGWIGSRRGNRVPLAAGGVMSAIGLAMLGLDHGTQEAILLWNAVASIGIGLAFAAMPNLIFEAVPHSQTGEATGINTLVRSVGSSLGSQVSAAVLTASIAAGAIFPSDSGFTAAFLIGAGVSAVAAVIAALVPRAGGEHLPVGAEVGAASPLAEPAYSADG